MGGWVGGWVGGFTWDMKVRTLSASLTETAAMMALVEAMAGMIFLMTPGGRRWVGGWMGRRGVE